MNKKIDFQVANTNQLLERISQYFTSSGFTIENSNNDALIITQKGSFFDTWKTNPLQWKSKTTISIAGNSIAAEFNIDDESQLKTVEEENTWNSFVNNFKLFLTTNVGIEDLNKEQINNAKKSRKIYVAYAVAGAVTGGLLNILLSNKGFNSVLSILPIPIFAALFLKIGINYRKRRHTSVYNQ